MRPLPPKPALFMPLLLLLLAFPPSVAVVFAGLPCTSTRLPKSTREEETDIFALRPHADTSLRSACACDECARPTTCRGSSNRCSNTREGVKSRGNASRPPAGRVNSYTCSPCREAFKSSSSDDADADAVAVAVAAPERVGGTEEEVLPLL